MEGGLCKGEVCMGECVSRSVEWGVCKGEV